MERIPKQGEFYRHFKNRMYQVLAIASHSETGEKMVVYQALYGDFGVYVRPLLMFMEPVDRDKYPNVTQSDRFERVTPAKSTEQSGGTDAKPQLHSLLLSFLEAESYGERMLILETMKGKVGRLEVDSLYLSLDVGAYDGTPDEQLENLKKHLELQQRFDASRLRRSSCDV